MLEARIAPAAVLTFTDVDGDSIVVKTSKGTNADLEPLIKTEAMGMGVAIREIDLSKAWTIFDGTDVSVLVTKKSATGDGLVNVRYIDASAFVEGGDMNLGRVVVQGDLGHLDAGKYAGVAVASLKLKSFGVADAAMNQSPLTSFVHGGIGSVSVSGTMTKVFVTFTDAGTISVGALEKGGFDGTGDVTSVRLGSMTFGILKAASFGKVTTGSMGPANIVSATESIGALSIGGSANESVEIGAASLGTLTVKGSFAGEIKPGVLNRATILGDFTGLLQASSIGTLRITGDVTAKVEARGFVYALGNVGAIRVGGDVLGGFGNEIGYFEIGGNVGSIRIGGSVKGFQQLTEVLPAMEVDDNGAIRVGGDVGKLSIAGDLVGTSLLGGGHTTDSTGAVIVQGNLGSAVIGGSVIAGQKVVAGLQSSGTIQVGKNLGSLLIKGDVIGGFDNRVFITALGADGPGTALAIGKITVLGDVKDAWIRAGDDGTEILNNNSSRDESIGTLRIGGDFVRSFAHAGQSGTINAPEITSKIARIVIGGSATGGNDMQSYGFLAEEFGAVRVAGKNYVLKAGALNDPEINLDPTGNTILHEKTS